MKWPICTLLVLLLSSCSNPEKEFTATCKTLLEGQLQEARVNTGDNIKVSNFRKVDYRDVNDVNIYFGDVDVEGRGGKQELRWVCSADRGQTPIVLITKITNK